MAISSASHATSASLLQRLRGQGDVLAWNRFTDLYTPLLFYWARRAGLQEADAADLVQEVFAVLVRTLPTFKYEAARSFRGWLRMVLLNKWRELHRRRSPAAEAGVDLDGLADPAFDSSCSDDDFRAELTRRALELLRQEFQPDTWEAFHQTSVLGNPASAVAGSLGLTLNAVYIARSRVLQRLRQELAGMA